MRKESIKLAAAAMTAALATSVTLIAGCATTSAPAEDFRSMRGAEVNANDVLRFANKDYVGKKPGLQAKVARTFSTQPPLIPHAVENFDEVTLEENQCLSCHGPAKYQEKKAPKIGDSHFINPMTGQKLADTSKARHNCVQCHVPQVDANPLVENTFSGNMPSMSAK